MAGKTYENLNELFTNVFNEVTKLEERSMRLVTEDNLSITEVHTLDAIGKSGYKSMSEVATQLKITISTLTISINRLVNKGYVFKSKTREDRRVVKVGLTDEGLRIYDIHKSFHHKMVNATIGNLKENELDVFTNCVENLLKFFKNEDNMVAKLLETKELENPKVDYTDIIEVETVSEIVSE